MVLYNHSWDGWGWWMRPDDKGWICAGNQRAHATGNYDRECPGTRAHADKKPSQARRTARTCSKMQHADDSPGELCVSVSADRTTQAAQICATRSFQHGTFFFMISTATSFSVAACVCCNWLVIYRVDIVSHTDRRGATHATTVHYSDEGKIKRTYVCAQTPSSHTICLCHTAP